MELGNRLGEILFPLQPSLMRGSTVDAFAPQGIYYNKSGGSYVKGNFTKKGRMVYLEQAINVLLCFGVDA